MRFRPVSGAIAVAALLAAVTGAAASVPAPIPLQVKSASVGQEGQQVVWHVRMAGPFSAAGLRHDRRSLCLVIERVKRGTAVGEVCLAAGPRRPLLLYLPAVGGGFGRARVVRATITRGGADEMTATFLPARFDPSYRWFRWQVASTLRTCAAGAATDCTSSYPIHGALARLHVPRVVGCVPSGSSLVYGGPATKREIALTFDDGPWPQPPSMTFVNLLAHYHVPATFFEIGNQISEYDPTGAIERAMIANGDMIGDHTWTHPNMTALSPAAQTSELEQTVGAIRHATGGFAPCLWRPPYGSISPSLISLARSLGLLTVMWNIDPRDWALPGVGSIEGNVLTNARNGGIVEMHFGGGPRYETIDSLPTIINTLRARGYRFVNLAQMFGLRLLYR